MKLWLKKNKYWLYCMYLPLYLISFFLVEAYITGSSEYWVSYTQLDKLIPFIDWFVIFYYMWYPILFGVGLWLLAKDRPVFERYMQMIIIGFSLSIIVFVIFPNGQNLRPTILSDNIFSKLIAYTYSIDTNTNVLPSIHVYASIVAIIAVMDTTSIKHWWVSSIICAICILICASTVFVKQHSILDLYAAIVMAIPIFLLVYWKKLFRNKNRLNNELKLTTSPSNELPQDLEKSENEKSITDDIESEN